MTRILGTLLMICLALVGVGLQPPSAFADEVSNLMKEADEAYKRGEYGLALNRLEQASNLVKDVQAANIIQFFPKPLEGWKIAETEQGASPIPNVQLGLFSSVVRKYQKVIEAPSAENLLAKDSKEKPKVPWIQFMLVQKPGSLIAMGFQGAQALRANDPKSRSVSVDGHSGIIYCDDRKSSCDAFLDFDGDFMLMVNGERVSRDEMEAYVKAFDVSGLLSGS